MNDRDVTESLLFEILNASNQKLAAVLIEGDEFGEQALRSPGGPGQRSATV